jgi:hypothetical protein
MITSIKIDGRSNNATTLTATMMYSGNPTNKISNDNLRRAL